MTQDDAMRVEVQIFRTKKLDDSMEVFVINEDSAEKRALGINVVRKGAF